MQMMYVVTGHSGDCDGTRQWPVHGYADPSAAQRHREAAQAWCDKVETLFMTRGDELLSALAASGIRHPFDARYAPDAVRTRYTVEAIPGGEPELDLSCIAAWSLAPATAPVVAACVQDLFDDQSFDRGDAIRYTLLREGVDPESPFEGQPAWQAVAARLPAMPAESGNS